MRKLYTLAQAAEILGNVTPDTLRVQVRKGRLDAILIGKTYVVDQAALEAYRRDHQGKIGRPVGAKDGPDVVRPRGPRKRSDGQGHEPDAGSESSSENESTDPRS